MQALATVRVIQNLQIRSGGLFSHSQRPRVTPKEHTYSEVTQKGEVHSEGAGAERLSVGPDAPRLPVRRPAGFR